MSFLIILLAFTFFIILVNAFFLIVFPNFNRKNSNQLDFLGLSVIVAFKNEEKNLENLFSSINKLDYPKDKIEVILVDDCSTDNSYHKATELLRDRTNMLLIKAEDKKFPGKKGALDIGISKSKFPYIIITDADCQPAKNWLIGYSQKFNEDYDILFGLAPFIQTEVLINKISCFENLRSSLLTFSLAKLGLPYSAAARNFGIKKSSFEKLNGFSNTLETLSGDDDLMIREAVKQKMKIGIVDYAETFVLSKTKNTIGEYVEQKARHTKTSLHYLSIHKLLLGFWHSSNILLIFSLLLLPLHLLYGIPFLLKLFSDLIVISLTQRKFQYRFKLVEVPILQLVYEVFLITNFFSSFKKTIPWKN